MAEDEKKADFFTGTMSGFPIEKRKAPDGTWILYQLNFKTDEGEERVFSAFNGLGKSGKGLKIDDLQKGTKYTVGWDDKSGNGKQTAYWIGIPKVKKVDNSTQTTSKTFVGKTGEIAKVEFNKDSTKFDEFFTEYVKNTLETKRELNVNHFTGYFIRSHHGDLAISELTEWLDYCFEEIIKKEAQLQSEKEIQM